MSVALQFVPAAPMPDHVPSPLGGSRPDATVYRLHPPAEPPRARPLRLTRRGVVVLSALVAVLAGALVWLGALSAPRDGVAAHRAAPVPATVTVRGGDTLWAIAARVAPQRDPRVEVARLQQLNHLDSVALVPGQVLHLR